MADKKTDQPVVNDDDPRFLALTSAERRDIVTTRIKQREAAMLGLWMDIVEVEENRGMSNDQVPPMREQADALGRVAKRLHDLVGGETSL